MYLIRPATDLSLSYWFHLHWALSFFLSIFRKTIKPSDEEYKVLLTMQSHSQNFEIVGGRGVENSGVGVL